MYVDLQHMHVTFTVFTGLHFNLWTLMKNTLLT